MRLLIYALLPLLTSSFVLQAPFVSQRCSTQLFAESGPPKYDKLDGVLREAEVVGEGSVMLHVDVVGDEKVEYKPGHVLALEIEDTKDPSAEADNEGWMRGPYTVSRSTESSMDILIKVVGKKSRFFAEAPTNTPVRFGGKFKVPILDGIVKEEVKKVILMSTGVGVGPCVGAIEAALTDGSFPPIELLASYRTSEEIIYGDYLDELSEKNADQFTWNPIVTSKMGRISSSEENIKMACPDGFSVNDVHYHLIGNAQLVNEWKTGLQNAGVPDNRVTVEQYFNHKASVDENVINDIAAVISTRSAVEA